METFFAGEIATELVKELLKVVRRTYLCRPAAEQLKRSVDALLPIVQEIRHSGVELPQHRQSQLSELADQLHLALDLARKAAASPRWNVYRSMQLAHRMERLDRWISRWVERHMPAHVLADVHHLRVDYAARLDRIERTLDMTAASSALAAARVPVAVGSVPFSGSPLTEMMDGLMPTAAAARVPVAVASVPFSRPPLMDMMDGLMPAAAAARVPVAVASVPFSRPPLTDMMDGLMPAAAAARVPVAVGTAPSSGFPVAEMMEGLVLRGEGEKPVGVGIKVGKERVKEMLMAGGDRAAVVGISGIGGSGKTTLAKEICRDPQIRKSNWFQMHFPKAEVLVLNFSADQYSLPPFLSTMPKLKVLVLINYGTSCTLMQNLSVFTTLNNLRSLWLEKIAVPPLPKTTVPLQNLRKVSLVLCELNNSLKGSKVDLSMTLPHLSHLTIDHCIDLTKLPSSICNIGSLQCISISNCHDLSELPGEFGKLTSLEILRVYACPSLKRLPQSICQLKRLKYLDISQSFNLRELPEELGHLTSLEKIDMRECSQLRTIPRSSSSLKSLGHVICDEEVALLWKEAERCIPDLRVQVAEECFNLDWLVE
ncbi:hypothetical protein BHE74_00015156 [Ensete ventricosum]|nr:hypothetical protein BHE74_00015156 [Ensete ventricosum]